MTHDWATIIACGLIGGFTSAIYSDWKRRRATRALRELVTHCWIHSNYSDCGYREMTSEQKRLYNQTVGRKCPHGWI